MHTNALIHEKSPYLKQHAHNPVDWLPWGQEAFERARQEDKPIFLSIGYSTCHWCHVMAHESFESESLAAALNQNFVPIKVDREERPDVDRIYMLFVQATTGGGGWPMSVWLTPELKPFFGGTYFPPDSRWGRPGFGDVLAHLAKAWKQDRQKIESSSVSVADQLQSLAASAKSATAPDRALFEATFSQLDRAFDSRWGGFGGAPKFPRPVAFNYLFRYYALTRNEDALEMALLTLRRMAAGGMHDHLGGGFHRYSVDERWFVPHFEKMLYDQAQLAISYLEAYQITKTEEFAITARDILGYVIRDLRDAAGGFYSAEDADSPDPENPSHSGEGAFYIWRESEIKQFLGNKAADVFCVCYGVQEYGNVDNDPHGEFTGRNILYRALAPEEAARKFNLTTQEIEQQLAATRQVLLTARSARPRPHLDNKILTSWNSLMISALAKASVVLGDENYLRCAKEAAQFLLSTMYNAETGQLLRRFCDGEAAVGGFADDYAFFAQALLDLFEASSDPMFLERCLHIVRRGLSRFEDTNEGGFFSTLPAQDLLLRMKDDYDGAEPTANSVATDLLLRLAHLLGDENFRASAEKSIRASAPKLQAQPTSAPQLMVALGRYFTIPEQIVIRSHSVDSQIRTLAAEQTQGFDPYTAVLCIADAGADSLRHIAPFLANLNRQGSVTVYHCRNFVCELPKVLT